MPNQHTIRLLGRHPGGINDLLVLADGSVLTAGTDGAICRWQTDRRADADSNGPMPPPLIRFDAVDHYANNRPAQTSALSLDLAGSTLACGLKHGVVELRDVHGGARIRTLDNPQVKSRHRFDFCRVVFNPADANQLLATNRAYVNVWDVRNGQILWSDVQFSTANTVAFLRSGSRLLVQEWDPWLHLLHWPGGKREHWQYELMEGSYNFLTTRAAPAGAREGFDLVLSALDAAGGHVVAMNIDQEAAVWQADFRDRQHDVDIAADGSCIVTAGEEGTLRVLSAIGQLLHEIDVDTHPLIGAEAKEAGEPKSAGMILTTNDLEDDAFYATAIHRVKLLTGTTSAIAALVSGLLLRIDW
ncbi:MAG: WD40 repeat domain-containing protein [Mycobacterium sp.]